MIDIHDKTATDREAIAVGRVHMSQQAVRALAAGELPKGDAHAGTDRHGSAALLEVTQIGKECHEDCEIKAQTGRCVMPTEGVFVKVLVGGEVRAG